MTSPSHIKSAVNPDWTGLEVDPAWFGVPPDNRAFQRAFDDLLNAQPESAGFPRSDLPPHSRPERAGAGFEGDAMGPDTAREANGRFRLGHGASRPDESSESKVVLRSSDAVRSAGPSADESDVEVESSDEPSSSSADRFLPGDEQIPEDAARVRSLRGPSATLGDAGRAVRVSVGDGLEGGGAGKVSNADKTGVIDPQDGDPDGVPAPATGLEIDSLAEDSAPRPNVVADSGESRPPNPHSGNSGTSAAKQDSNMENGQEQKQFADDPEQYLPEDAEADSVMDSSVGDPETLVPAPDPLKQRTQIEPVSNDPDEFEPDSGTEMDSWELLDSGESGDAGGESGETRSLSPARMIERVQDQISRIALELRRFDARTLSVVLRPDGMTRLAVQLKIEAGQIEMQARFESGDFTAFNSHWPQLQQELANLGIRVAALESAPNEVAPDLGRATRNPGSSPEEDSDSGGRDGRGDGDAAEPDRTTALSATDPLLEHDASPNTNVKPDGWEQWA